MCRPSPDLRSAQSSPAKRTFRSAARRALAAIADPPAAHAQSNVTLYGIADVYLQFGKGDKTQTSLQSGGLQGSRLGFKGSEDLGGGMKAFFQLEHGIALDTGSVTQGGVFWGRQALVGLSGGFGEVGFGRQYASHFLTIDAADPFDTAAGSGAGSGIMDRAQLVASAPRGHGVDGWIRTCAHP